MAQALGHRDPKPWNVAFGGGGRVVPTLEPSHQKTRVMRPRPTDIADTVGTAERRHRNHGSDGRFQRANDAARARRSKSAITKATAKRAAAAELAHVEGAQPTDADLVAHDAMALYGDARRHDLDHDGPMVRAPAFTWSYNTALAAYYHEAARSAGLATERGMALVELAHRCEARAERAEAMALAADTRMAKRPKGDEKTEPWMQEAGA